MALFTVLFATLAASAVTDRKPEPKPPAVTYLYTSNLTTSAPADIGPGPFGSRGIISITGGTFSGPKLSGNVVSGLDWGLTDAKGTFSPDAVYVLHTKDGANIMVTETGHAPNVNLLFETGSDKYAWLNKIVAYGAGTPIDGGVMIDAFQIGS